MSERDSAGSDFATRGRHAHAWEGEPSAPATPATPATPAAPAASAWPVEGEPAEAEAPTESPDATAAPAQAPRELPFDAPEVGVYHNPEREESAHAAGPFGSQASGHADTRRRGGCLIPLLAALAGAALALAGAAYLISAGYVSLGPRSSEPTVGPTGEQIVDVQTNAPDWVAVASAVKPSTVSVRASSGSDGAQGAGFIFDEAGHVVTNTHVIAGQETITVQLDSGVIVETDVVGADESTDIAVLAMKNPPPFTPASLGDSGELIVGQPVAAIGNPLGLSQSISSGIISALNRPVSTVESQADGRNVVTNAIQVDAATNEGNSGGALVDAHGRVIGVTSALARETAVEAEERPAGIGFAIPINLAKSVAAQLIESGHASHAWLDVACENVWVRAEGVSQLGAHITSVGAGAAGSGLAVDDTIVALNGQPIVSANSLIGTVREYRPGDVVRVTVVRQAGTLEFDVRLGEG